MWILITVVVMSSLFVQVVWQNVFYLLLSELDALSECIAIWNVSKMLSKL